MTHCQLGMHQLTGTNFAYQHHSLERCLRDMAQFGRRHFELWGIAPHADIGAMDLQEARSLAKLLDSYGMSALCLTPEQVAYPVNIASPDPGLRQRSIDHFKHAVHLCSVLGADFLFLTSGRGAEDEPKEVAWERSRDALAEITAYSDRYGLRCLLEPLQRVESNLVIRSAHAARMLEEVDSPNLGVCLDTVAMAAAGETVETYLTALPDLIWHVHLVDGTPTGHLAWPEGNLDLGAILASLAQAGYTGMMTTELFGSGRYALAPQMAFRRSFETIEREMAALATGATGTPGKRVPEYRQVN